MKHLVLIAAAAATTSAFVDTASAAPLTALTTTNQLLTYDTAAVAVAPASIPITGLTGGESVLGIDYRPATGGLYGVTNQNRLYTIFPSTGVATLVATLSTALNLGGTNPAIGFDFNPVPDLIRIIANRSGQNLRVNPLTGVVTVDTTLPAYAAGDAFAGQFPQIASIGYLPASGGVTTLYGYDDTTDRMVRVGGVGGTPSPNSGVATTVAGLGGVNGSHLSGMDVAPDGIGYLSLDVGGSVFRLFQVDLTVTNPNTNASTLLGTFNTPAGAAIADIAVVVIPEPTGLMGIGLGLLTRRRSRRSR